MASPLLIALGYQFKADEPRADNPKLATTTHANPDEDIPALCRAALAVIPNECDREEWVKMCYANRDAGLDFEDWQQWCNKWHRPNKRGSVEAAWDSCKTPRSVTFRTLCVLFLLCVKSLIAGQERYPRARSTFGIF